MQIFSLVCDHMLEWERFIICEDW